MIDFISHLSQLASSKWEVGTFPAKGPAISANVNFYSSITVNVGRKVTLYLIHSFKASSDLLISAPSSLVCLSAELDTAPRSLPARSMRENLPDYLNQIIRTSA